VICTDEVRITFYGIAWEAQKKGPFFKVVKDLMEVFFSYNGSEEEDQIARSSAWNKLLVL